MGSRGSRSVLVGACLFFLQFSTQKTFADSPEMNSPKTKSWWDGLTRFSNQSDPKWLSAVGFNAVVGCAGLSDEGRGPYFSAVDHADNAANVAELAQKNIKMLGWLEGQGQSRAFIVALNQMSAGVYEKDARFPGAAAIQANNWSWDFAGPAKNSKANTARWIGLGTTYNEEAWLGSYRSSQIPDLPRPATWDGKVIPLKGKDLIDPRESPLYFHLAGKNVFGGIAYEAHPLGEQFNGKLEVTENNKKVPAGDFSFNKDQASPFWNSYNLWAARQSLSRGSHGFWVDNYSGWDFISSAPVRVAFGDWSVGTFKTFLKNKKILKEKDAAQFDIRKYVLEKAKKIAGSDLEKSGDLSHGAWSSRDWLSDPYWLAFLAFKSQIAQQRAMELYDGIKHVAKNLKLDPDQIYVSGNDSPSIAFAAITGNEMDQIHTEYSPFWSLHAGSKGQGLLPEGHYGPFAAMGVNFAKSPFTAVWFYLDDPALKKQENLARLIALEALANNSLLNTDVNEKGEGRMAGTPQSVREVNGILKYLDPLISGRRRAGETAILMSTQTQLSFMTPGGHFGFDVAASPKDLSNFSDHSFGILGWGAILEDLQRPYQVVTDFRFTLQSLRDVKLLILPHIKVFSEKMLKEVLIPYLKSGGNIWITGIESGVLMGRDDLFKTNSTNPIEALLKMKEFKNQIIYSPYESIGRDFHFALTEPAKRMKLAQDVRNRILELEKKTGVSSRISQVPTTIRVTQSRLGSVQFYDFVNTQYNRLTDKITPHASFKVRIKIANAAKKRSYEWIDPVKQQSVMIEPVEVKGSEVVLSLSGFEVYGILKITELLN